jgi:hypothetical protein
MRCGGLPNPDEDYGLFAASIVAEELRAVALARVATMAVELAEALPYPTSCCLAPVR